MPTYEYRCEGCGEVFEVRQKFADEPLTQHDKCGGHVHRLLSAPALQFKGSGWYVTDYAKSGASKSEGKSEGNSETKTESKTESKTDSNGTKSTVSESKSTSTESSSKSDSKSDDSKK
jgi:putative FmdB family regulatory protein